MSDQIEYAGFEASEFAENPDPRVACVLLLDTSGSMSEVVGVYDQVTGETVMQDGQMYNVVSGGKTRIDLLNEGLIALKESLAADSLASRRAEIAIVTFGGTVTTIQDFVTAENFQPPRLQASGGTPMGQAILAGLDMISKRKATYRSAGISYYRPWIFLITDGGPDHADPWKDAAAQVKEGEAKKSFAFFTVAVEGANMDVLAQISTRPPAKLKGVNFREMFLWLSQSMQAVSQSSPGETVHWRHPVGPRFDERCGSLSLVAYRAHLTFSQGCPAKTTASGPSLVGHWWPRAPTEPGARNSRSWGPRRP